MMIRTFTAVFLPEDARRQVAGLIERLQAPGDAVKWVEPGLLHFTLRFFGDLDEEAVARVNEITGRVATTLGPIRARLEGTGTFPPGGPPRVYWIGMGLGQDAMVRLARALELAYRDARLGRADKPFAPHLTIGRARTGRGPHRSPSAGPRDFGRLTFSGLEFIVQRVSVVRSDLSPHGPTYTPLAEHPLSGEG
jgi:2'-5' RNA ligase